MSWRDRLQPASFRGAAFSVQGHEHETGRRVAVHEYPGRDRPYAEDLGRRAREFSVEAFLVGADYMAARDRLLDVLEEAGPGVLVHPYLGRRTVSCREVRLHETAAQGGLCRLTLDFVESGRNEYPSDRPDRASAATAAAGAARQALRGAFLESYGP